MAMTIAGEEEEEEDEEEAEEEGENGEEGEAREVWGWLRSATTGISGAPDERVSTGESSPVLRPHVQWSEL
jgi:hypothetical protein